MSIIGISTKDCMCLRAVGGGGEQLASASAGASIFLETTPTRDNAV